MRVIQPMVTPDQTALTTAAAPRRNRFHVDRTAGTMPVWQPKGVEAASFADPATATPVVKTGTQGSGLGFKDVLDVINPLQHIPIVDTVYRKITGDEISAPAQFIGGMLYGGPIGGVAAMADMAIKDQTGRSMGDRAVAMFDKNSTQNATPDNQPVIKLASRWKDEPRMAGYVPVWGQQNQAIEVAQNTPPVTIPTGNMSSDTNFAMLLNNLSDKTPNIS